MATVDDDFTCPQCGRADAYVEFNTRTYAEHGVCLNGCGYSFEHGVFPKPYSREHRGVGAYSITAKNGVGTVGAFAAWRPAAERQRRLVRVVASRRTSFVAFSHQAHRGQPWQWIVLKDLSAPRRRSQPNGRKAWHPNPRRTLVQALATRVEHAPDLVDLDVEISLF